MYTLGKLDPPCAAMFSTDEVLAVFVVGQSLSDNFCHFILNSKEWLQRGMILKFSLLRLAKSPVVRVLTDEIYFSYVC